MKRSRIFAVVLGLALGSQGANSTTLAGSNTFVDLAWDLSGPGASGCTQIVADATGDASRSTRIVIYGTVNCPSLGSGLPMIGVAYVGTDGTFNMQFNIGLGVVNCFRMRAASGLCTVRNSAGVDMGTLYANLVP